MQHRCGAENSEVPWLPLVSVARVAVAVSLAVSGIQRAQLSGAQRSERDAEQEALLTRLRALVQAIDVGSIRTRSGIGIVSGKAFGTATQVGFALAKAIRSGQVVRDEQLHHRVLGGKTGYYQIAIAGW